MQLRGADPLFRSEHFLSYSKNPPHISCNWKATYSFHKVQPLVPTLNQI